MYCNFCNSQLPEGVAVCAVCGHDNAPVSSTPTVDTVPVAEQENYVHEAPAPAPEQKPKKAEDSLSSGISALVWGTLSALMSFGGLFFAMSPMVAIAGIIMSVISKKKAKLAKAYEGTVGAALAKGADAASTFALIASIYTLVMYVVVVALLIFFYVLYFIILMVALSSSAGAYYYY